METLDYNKFKMHPANREIKEASVKKIMISIKEHGYIKGRPILVDENNVIIDGQHRFVGLKNLGLPIIYEVIEGDAISKIMALNASQQQWNLIDYIESYAKQGIDCYRKMVKFHEKHKFGAMHSIAIMNNSSKFKSSDYKTGKIFEINPKADDIAQFIYDCDSVGYAKTKDFVRAAVILFRKASEEQIEVLKNKIITIPQCPSPGAYLVAFENILNRGKIAKNRIKLSQ